MKTSIITSLALSIALAATQVFADEPVSFRRDIAPILLANCLACHGAKKSEGSYRIDSYERAVHEGDSGSPGFAAKDLDLSEAYRRIVSDDEAERMPLEGEPLPAAEIALIKRWIEQGAQFDGPDPKAPLASIVPPPEHPAPPQAYPNTVPITALAFRPNGEELFVSGYHELTVWNAKSGKLLRRIKNVGERTYALAFSNDGIQLATAGGAPGRLGEVRLFDVETGNLIKVLATSSDVVFDVAFHPNGKLIAACSADGAIRVFDLKSGAEQRTITSHSDWVTAIAFNSDGTRLVSASRDKTAKVFDMTTGELLVTYSGHGEAVKGVAFHPDGEQVYSAGGDKKVQLWKIADGKKTADVTSFGGDAFRLTTGGAFLFAVSADKSARQFDLKSRKQIRAYAGHPDWVISAAYHDGGKRLATGGFNGEVRVWNTDDGKQITSFIAAPGYQASGEQ